MKNKQLEIVTDIQPQSAISVISRLLTKRSVEHTIEGNFITSTDIPIPFFNWDRRLYSQDNFVGVNPFVFIDSLTIEVKPNAGSKTQLHITTKRGRLYFPLVFIILCALWTLTVDRFAGAFFMFGSILYYLFAFRVVVRTLLLREIKKELQTNRGDRE